MSNLAFDEIEENTADILDLNQSDDNFSETDIKYSSLNINEVEINYSDEVNIPKNGILDETTLKNNLSNLGKTPDGLSYAMLDVRLVGMELENIDLLKNFIKLQNFDVSYNRISNLDILEFNENLICINASNNNLTHIFNHPINCAHFLREIDFSFNKIEIIPDLSVFYFLSKLNLDGNNIKDLNGLANCSRLVHLNVAHNQLDSIEPLELCPLNYLNVSYNNLSSLNGIENIIRLQELIASGNQIKSLDVFNEGHVALHKLDLEHNKIIDIQHLKPLKVLNLLRDLNLRHNPITEVPDYRLYVLFFLPKLSNLDGGKVEIEEKIKSENFLNPNIDIVAARDHRINCVNRFFKAQTVLYSTLQNSYTPYPMLVLVGPKGSGKKWLARKLVQNFPNFFGLAISHTDQPMFNSNKSTSEFSDDKEQQEFYQRVSRDEFESMRIKGCFLQTCKIGDYHYGLTVDSIEAVAREGLAGVIDMELEGVLSLKKTHFEPRYVLTMPLNRVIQESRIRYKAISPVGLDGAVKQAVSRVDMYIDINQSRPGFFDKFICTDDLDEAYINLKRLVMDYLGLTNEDVTETRTIDANSRLASTGNLTQSRATASQPKFSSQSHGSAGNRAALIEHESLQRRLNTARAALTRRNKDENFATYKTFNRNRTSYFDLENSDEDISSELSNNPTEISDLGYRSPNQQTPISNNELMEDIENSRDDLRTLQFSNQSSSSIRSMSVKAPREIQTNS